MQVYVYQDPVTACKAAATVFASTLLEKPTPYSAWPPAPPPCPCTRSWPA